MPPSRLALLERISGWCALIFKCLCRATFRQEVCRGYLFYGFKDVDFIIRYFSLYRAPTEIHYAMILQSKSAQRWVQYKGAFHQIITGPVTKP